MITFLHVFRHIIYAKCVITAGNNKQNKRSVFVVISSEKSEVEAKLTTHIYD